MFDMRAGMWNNEEELPWAATSLYDNYNLKLVTCLLKYCIAP
jgi:hypothetical protein